MRTVKFTPWYSAGIIAGAGLALFFVYLLSEVEAMQYTGWTRLISGIVGLVMLSFGGIWNVRLQARTEKEQ